MRSNQRVLLLLAITLAALALLGGWMSIPINAEAQAAVLFSSGTTLDPGAIPSHPAPARQPGGAPDHRWLRLVREGAALTGRLPESSFSINLNLTTNALAGMAPGLQTISAWLVRGGYTVAVGEAQPVPDPAGSFYQMYLNWYSDTCLPRPDCYAYGFETGDVVWVAQAGTSISMTVPLLTALAEPQDDLLHGSASPASSLTAYLIPFSDPTTMITQTGISDPGGSYQIDLSAPPGLHRQDTGYLLVETAPGRHAYVYWTAPFLSTQVGGAMISGLAAPNVPVTINVIPSGGGHPWIQQLHSDWLGRFGIEFSNGETQAARGLAPGDQVQVEAGEQVFSTTLPLLNASAILDPPGISGQAPPGIAVEVHSYPGPLAEDTKYLGDVPPQAAITVLSSADGIYTASLPMAVGDYGAAFVTLVDEHQAYARCATSWLYARMQGDGGSYGGQIIAGQVDALLEGITVSIQGPSGYLKDWAQRWTDSAGAFEIYPGDFSSTRLGIETGDVVRVETGEGEAISLSMPVLSASADQRLATVSGSAPPGARLTVVAEQTYPSYPLATAPQGDGNPYEETVTRVVTASLTGDYLADFSDQVIFNDYTHGLVSMEVPDGFRVGRGWSVRSCPPRLVYAQVGANRAMLSRTDLCTDYTVRLVDAFGNVKDEMVFNPFYHSSGLVFEDFMGVPILIQPGDRIQTTAQGGTDEITIPPLSVDIDPQSYQISGQAPPGERVQVAVVSFGGGHVPVPVPTPVIVTVTQAGEYQVDLGGGYVYAAGDTIDATLLDTPVEFLAINALPRLRTELYDQVIDAWMSPNSPYTLTLTTPITRGQESRYADANGSIQTVINAPNFNTLTVIPGSLLQLETPGVDTTLQVPTLTVNIDLQTATVSGQAPPDAHLRLDFQGNSDNRVIDGTVALTATAQGKFIHQIPFAPPLDQASGKLAYISPAGHEAYIGFRSPRLTVVLDDPCVEGYAPNPGRTYALILDHAAGSIIQDLIIEANPYDGWFLVCFDRPLAAGDRLELQDDSVTVLDYTVPNLLAGHDYARQVVEGWAPPGSAPKVIFKDIFGSEIARRPWLAADGSFGIDTSDLNLRVGDYGSLVLEDAYGNSTQRFFFIRGYPIYMPTVFQK